MSISSISKNKKSQKESGVHIFEFDRIMSGADALLEGGDTELIQQRKKLERQLIRLRVASPSKATSQTRKFPTREKTTSLLPSKDKMDRCGKRNLANRCRLINRNLVSIIRTKYEKWRTYRSEILDRL